MDWDFWVSRWKQQLSPTEFLQLLGVESNGVRDMIQVILAKPRAEVSKKGEAYRKWLCHIQFNLSVILLFY